MAFIEYYPFGNKGTHDINTTNSREKQLWQELVMIRHLNRPRDISAKKAMSPWIDQAKIYFLNAYKSDWRSAGLLYYYSFLNLAKAFIAAKRVIAATTLKSSNIYHGLAAKPQSPNQIIDFEIEIYPPRFNRQQNIFSTFYQKITKQRWPHTQPITVRLYEILPYCREITVEVEKFYGINSRIIYMQSLIREENNNVWFEVNLPSQSSTAVLSQLNSNQFSVVNVSSLTNSDKVNWLTAYERTIQSLHGTCFLRSHQFSLAQQNRNQIFNQVCQMANNAFSEYYCSLPIAGLINEFWQFILKINFNNSLIKWHPFLSDYLFAFILSTILRYHPHLLNDNDKNAFITEAWCAQSPITSLRYFLMALTTPPIRYN